MTTATTVPVTTEMDGGELDAEDAWHVARRHGLRRILVDAAVRMRYGDGFSSSRALALQACLAVVPLLIAVTGLAADIDSGPWRRVVARTVSAASPGGGSNDALAQAASRGSETSAEIALWFGLVFALISMVTAIGQVERGANRIYGIRRDRPAVAKYGRAALLTAVLAVPVGTGFLCLVGGDAFGDAMLSEGVWSAGVDAWWDVLRWPAGVALLVFTVAVLLDYAPRRRQPALSWLALGSGVAVTLSAAAAAGLAVYIKVGATFGEVYGPLAGVIALLLWSLLSSMSLFFGVAVCAQLEALRANQPEPAYDDPGRPHRSTAG